MLMKDDKKKMLTMIVKRATDKNSPAAEEMAPAASKDGAEQDGSIAQESAAEELMNAKDAKEFLAAFKSLLSLIEDEEQPEEADESAQA